MSERHESEFIPEQELAELFRPRRVEPEAFRRGVERRIREREAASATPSDRVEPAEPAWLRRAAALLFGEPGALGPAAGAGGAKVLTAGMALPVILLGTAVWTFVAGERSLRRSASAARPPDPAQAARRGSAPVANRDLRAGSLLLGAMKVVGFAAVIASPLIGGERAIDALFLVLLLSVAALALTVRGFASSGLFARADVARLGAGVLTSVFLACFLWLGGYHVPDATSALGIGWSAVVVYLGILAALASTRSTRAMMSLALVQLVLLAAINPFGFTRSSPSSLQAQLASMPLDAGELRHWSPTAALHVALSETGHATPPREALRQELAARIEEGTSGHTGIWTAALQMGLIDAEHRLLLASLEDRRRELDWLREGRLVRRLLPMDEHLFWLLDEGGASSPERAAIADRLEADRFEEEHDPLGGALLAVRGLDRLGFPDRAEGLRERVHRVLVRHWLPRGPFFTIPGGFSPDPERFRMSFDDHTWSAVQLMQRLGAPPEIDLRLLRGHLRTASRAVFFDVVPGLKAHSRAALLLLEEGIGLPRRSPLQRLLDERLFLASLSIVALCLLAIRLAPSFELPRAGGAQP